MSAQRFSPPAASPLSCRPFCCHAAAAAAAGDGAGHRERQPGGRWGASCTCLLTHPAKMPLLPEGIIIGLGPAGPCSHLTVSFADVVVLPLPPPLPPLCRVFVAALGGQQCGVPAPRDHAAAARESIRQGRWPSCKRAVALWGSISGLQEDTKPLRA
jgi:hypothetical protein